MSSSLCVGLCVSVCLYGIILQLTHNRRHKFTPFFIAQNVISSRGIRGVLRILCLVSNLFTSKRIKYNLRNVFIGDKFNESVNSIDERIFFVLKGQPIDVFDVTCNVLMEDVAVIVMIEHTYTDGLLSTFRIMISS